MSRKRMVSDRSKIKEKMSTYMMLMGHGDYQATVAKDLNHRIWSKKCKLSRKRCRRLLYLLYAADSCTLLSFTVCLGRSIWSDHLRAKQRKIEQKLAQKIKMREKKQLRRCSRPGSIKKLKDRKGIASVKMIHKGYRLIHVSGSRLRVIERHSRVTRSCAKFEIGSPMYRLALAMNVLSFRNVCITSEWEFWAICFIKQVCGFWRSIAFGDGLSDSLISMANEFGLCVVSEQVLERLESCYGCSSSVCYLGCRRVE